MATKPKRPRDPFHLAKLIGDISTGEAVDEDPNAGKNPAAVALGRLGGLKGGVARAKTLSAEQLSDIGKKGAAARAARKMPIEQPSKSVTSQPKRHKNKRLPVIPVHED